MNVLSIINFFENMTLSVQMIEMEQNILYVKKLRTRESWKDAVLAFPSLSLPTFCHIVLQSFLFK